MTISTRGRYALRVMIDLAEHEAEGFTPLKAITERQNISQKYLEGIMTSLSKAGLVKGAHGKGGGYRLSREPEDYKVSEILTVTEGSLAPVSCLKPDAPPCSFSESCRTLTMWKELNRVINEFFSSYTVADLMVKDKDFNNWII